MNITSISENPEKDNILAFLQNKFISLNILDLEKVFENLGVVCSTNENPMKGVEILKLSCSDNLITLKHKMEAFYAECPLDCNFSPNLQIYGSLIYKGDSSICKSAIHSGFLNLSSQNDCKNFIEVIPTVASGYYEGKQQNSIESFEFNSNSVENESSASTAENNIAFIINPIIEECPRNILQDEYQDYMKKVKSASFLEFNSGFNVSKKVTNKSKHQKFLKKTNEATDFIESKKKNDFQSVSFLEFNNVWNGSEKVAIISKIQNKTQNLTNLTIVKTNESKNFIDSIKQFLVLKNDFKRIDESNEYLSSLNLHLYENFERSLNLNLRSLLLFNENLKFKENFGTYLNEEIDFLMDSKSILLGEWKEKSKYWLNFVATNLKTILSNLNK